MKLFRFALAAVVIIIGSGVAIADTKANVCVQGELKALGYYSGEITGKIDKATKAAAGAYIEYMEANNPGWAQPDLASNQAPLWCRQLAAAYPKELSKYLAAYQAEDASVVRPVQLTVDGKPNTSEPYRVTVDFEVVGDYPATVTAACFTWNGRSEICVAPGKAISKGPLVVGLTTGRAGSYDLAVYLKYESGGKALKSAMTSFRLEVEE